MSSRLVDEVDTEEMEDQASEHVIRKGSVIVSVHAYAQLWGTRFLPLWRQLVEVGLVLWVRLYP